MLTRDDETVPDARALYRSVSALGLGHIGCKDVGVPLEEVAALAGDARADGVSFHLEVVSETEEATLRSARAAAALRPDYLVGGTLVEPVQEVLRDTGIRFFPYIGRIVGHPCLLRGSIADICADARRVERAGVDGINLLAYRYDGDVRRLVAAVLETTDLPVLCAGSVDSLARIAELAELGVWGFTIGTAALDGRLVEGADLAGQLAATVDAAAAGTPAP